MGFLDFIYNSIRLVSEAILFFFSYSSHVVVSVVWPC